MEICLARLEDVECYRSLGHEAQVWLMSQGLAQYVPSAWAEYHEAIRGRVQKGTLFRVESSCGVVGFFSLDPEPTPWWPCDSASALYLSGMVVSRQIRGQGVGGEIIHWCVAEARKRQREFVRLDCHSGNLWLCRYYELHDFERQGVVEQHPGYWGVLYQLSVATFGMKERDY